MLPEIEDIYGKVECHGGILNKTETRTLSPAYGVINPPSASNEGEHNKKDTLLRKPVMEELEGEGFVGYLEPIEPPDWAESLDSEFTTILVDELLEQYCLPSV